MEQFETAVQEGDPARLRTLLTDHPELRAAIDRPTFETAPAIVFWRHNRAMVDVLLEFGADVNTRSQFWGRTVGVLDDNTPEMRAYLIGRGALPEIGEFVRAVKVQDAATVRTLLTNTPALRGHIDRPLFHFGSQAIINAKENREIVGTLLEFDANINARSDWWAGSFGVLDETDPEQAAWLIERGAIVDIHAAAGLGMLDKVKEWLAKDPSLVHAPGGDGQRPLHFARTTAIIDVLLDHGADVNVRDVDHQSTAAQYKVRDAELCRQLTVDGHAQLSEAASSNALSAVTLMLKLGFDVNARGGEGFTPVASAALRGLAEIVRTLMAHGADVEIRNDYGGAALQTCQWGSLNFCNPNGDYPACAEALLQGGATSVDPHFGSEDVQAVLRRYAARSVE